MQESRVKRFFCIAFLSLYTKIHTTIEDNYFDDRRKCIMKKSYAVSIILGTVCGFMAVITSPLHPIMCPFLVLGYLLFTMYPIGSYVEEKGVPQWVYHLLKCDGFDDEEDEEE